MRTLWIALLAVVVPSVAFSQPASPRGFVGLGVLAFDDRTWQDPEIVPAATVAAGVDVNPIIGLRLEVDVPRYVTKRYTFARSNSVQTERRRSETWSGLVDFHRDLTTRFRVGFVTGLTTAVRPEDYSTTIDTPATGSTPARHTESHMHRQFDWWGGLTAGGEAVVGLGAHAAIVPEVRVTNFWYADAGRNLIVRSGVTFRLRF